MKGFALMAASGHHTTCPSKGSATLWSGQPEWPSSLPNSY